MRFGPPTKPNLPNPNSSNQLPVTSDVPYQSQVTSDQWPGTSTSHQLPVFLALPSCILLSAVVSSVASSFVLSHSRLSPLENPPMPSEFQS